MTEGTIESSPPRRPRELLQSWVTDFENVQADIAGRVTVAPQEDEGVDDTGLVILRLHNGPISVYMQPRGYDDPLWKMTLTPQPKDLVLDVHSIATLAAELVVASNLCTFLQWKSLEWDRQSGQHPTT